MSLVSLARNPIPSGAVAATFAGYDGAPLRYARWEATRGPRRGTICLFQGRTEMIEKYFEVVSDLRRRGFAVATLDWRGQGGSHRALSDTRKGHVGSFKEYDRDLSRFMKDVVLPDCPPPYIALAHSMGGNILLRAATQSAHWFDRMVLAAPMLGFSDAKVPTGQRLARGLAETLSLIGLGRAYVPGGSGVPEELTVPFEKNALTSDAMRFARTKALLEAAPAQVIGSPTIGWLKAAYRSCANLERREVLQRVDVPMMLIVAGDDRVVSNAAIERAATGIKISALVTLAGARHELMMEQDAHRDRFWKAFDAYLGVTAAAA